MWLTWAATVCDLVGKSLEMQAVLKPASESPKAAYREFSWLANLIRKCSLFVAEVAAGDLLWDRHHLHRRRWRRTGDRWRCSHQYGFDPINKNRKTVSFTSLKTTIKFVVVKSNEKVTNCGPLIWGFVARIKPQKSHQTPLPIRALSCLTTCDFRVGGRWIMKKGWEWGTLPGRIRRETWWSREACGGHAATQRRWKEVSSRPCFWT